MTIYTLTATATPVLRQDDGTTCWEPFTPATKHHAEIPATNPADFRAALVAWAKALPAPTGTYDGEANTGYTVTVSPPRGARWPRGFRATFERRSEYVGHLPPVPVA